MIEFHEVTKFYRVNGRRHVVIDHLDFRLPDDRNTALIGRNGAGKSTLLAMIGGSILPSSGRIRREGRVSWPMGFAGGLHPALSGRQNARFMARVYGSDTDAMVDFVEEFSELGAYLDMPMTTYSSGMKARLAFAISLAAEFDLYLIDEITEVGDRAFREKCRRAFQERSKAARLLIAAHSEATLKSYCQSALLIEKGQAWYFDRLDDGLAAYRKLLAS